MNKLTLIKTMLFKNTPVYVHYGITHRCNLRCRMCGVWKTGCRDSELKTDEIEKMADVLKKLGTQVISIGGGEPLIREDLPEAVRFFLRRGISVRVLTNGVINDLERLERLIDAGVVNYSISLDTLESNVQNHIIGQEGAFDRVMDTFRYLSPILKRKKGLGLINTVVSSANMEKLKDLVEFAEETGFYVSFVPLEVHHFSGKVLGCTDTMADMNFSDDERGRIRQVFNELALMKKRGRRIFNSSAFLIKAGDYLSGKSYEWKCMAGRLYFSISPEGKFSICHRYSGYSPEGNDISILDPDLFGILKSREYRESTDSIQKTCGCCLRPCWAEISFLFGDIQALFEMIRIQMPG